MTANVIRATIAKAYPLAHGVRAFVLRTPSRVPFLAGQWLDVFLPKGLVGGYSLFTGPTQHAQDSCLHIAVKRSRHPAAEYMHDKCAEGQELDIAVGGDVYFDPAVDFSPLLLIGGGIGVSPLVGILQEAASAGNRHCQLLQTSRTSEGLLFEPLVDALAKHNNEYIGVQKFVTREPSGEAAAHYRRMERADVEQALAKLKATGEQPLAYVCGPPAMVKQASAELEYLGLPEDRIRYERWV